MKKKYCEMCGKLLPQKALKKGYYYCYGCFRKNSKTKKGVLNLGLQ